MSRGPGDRIFGVETEFGCLVAGLRFGSPEQAAEAIKDHIFLEERLGAIDVHARDEVFEPAQSGGFLANGGRLYVDAVGSHLEYATAECRSLRDLIAHDRAGHRLIVRAIREMGLQDEVSVYNNSVDHFGGHTFGCHENYLARLAESYFSDEVRLLYPFLVTRQIYAGAGRAGGHVLTMSGPGPTRREVGANPIDYIWVSQVYGVEPDPAVEYQLSQRADHIVRTIASRVRFNRALVNPKWEHFYDHDGMQRLHLLFGESNQMEYAFALKTGATLLAIRLVEEGLAPDRFVLAQPLVALRDVSRDATYKWNVRLADGSLSNAVEVQRAYLEAARAFEGESEMTEWTLEAWDETLRALSEDPVRLDDRLDWVAKLKILRQYMDEEGLDWGHDALHSVDLEYHNIDPERSLFHALQEMGATVRVLDDLDIVDAMTDPPRDTRAYGRAKLVRKVLARKGPSFYAFDWSGVALARDHYVHLDDPFEPYAGVAGP
jgi:proteasome accessory factor A